MTFLFFRELGLSVRFFHLSIYYLHTMSENVPKVSSNDQIRCVKCQKLVAKILFSGHFEIKCLRCETLNELVEKNDGI